MRLTDSTRKNATIARSVAGEHGLVETNLSLRWLYTARIYVRGVYGSPVLLPVGRNTRNGARAAVVGRGVWGKAEPCVSVGRGR